MVVAVVRIKKLVAFYVLLRISCGNTQSTFSRFAITAPGTKWCGPGNIADNYDDLGVEAEADKCCRAHDHCHESIKAHSTEFGLENDELFPVFRCQCETKFRACLQSVNSMVSNTLGRVYFSSRSRCYDSGHPIITCVERQWDTFRQRCINYEVNTDKPEQWQFYDLPFYTIRSENDDENND